MFEWAWPWLFVLLPLPWFIARVLKPTQVQEGAALRLPIALNDLEAASGANPVARWKRMLAWIAWTLLLVAAARPQWIGDAVDVPRSGRDLLLAVDASGSMDTPDMQIGGQAVSRYGRGEGHRRRLHQTPRGRPHRLSGLRQPGLSADAADV